jgi:hypothetical protein
MTVTIEIRQGRYHDPEVYKEDMQKNIDALNRAIKGTPLCADDILLLDTLSIIEGIQKKLPFRYPPNSQSALTEIKQKKDTP